MSTFSFRSSFANSSPFNVLLSLLIRFCISGVKVILLEALLKTPPPLEIFFLSYKDHLPLFNANNLFRSWKAIFTSGFGSIKISSELIAPMSLNCSLSINPFPNTSPLIEPTPIMEIDSL